MSILRMIKLSSLGKKQGFSGGASPRENLGVEGGSLGKGGQTVNEYGMRQVWDRPTKAEQECLDVGTSGCSVVGDGTMQSPCLQGAVTPTLILEVGSVQDQSSVLDGKFLCGDRDDDLGTSRRGTGAGFSAWRSNPHCGDRGNRYVRTRSPAWSQESFKATWYRI